ncbi:hypothetical protein [Celeribacter indicus]|uniref:Uncharacterized protein n=1 Tax=Celeribacter indicus TaxID=1208324 RepID=A0A0B5DY69_9RHOB|nr:hypothetical protein [Celeribacter indicus]AJE47954.1 hypothetical protein P73_3239 [Celeribacter indicus]SDW27917.1 hypothetical protein SAMN05443573_102230 [Celeribacter indicus]
MAYSKQLTARIAGKVANKFPGIPAITLDSIVDEALLERERLSAARGDSVDEVAAASGTTAPSQRTEADRERDRMQARQDAALHDIKAQSRGGR